MINLGVRGQGFFNSPLTFANAYLPFVLLAFSFLLIGWGKTKILEKILLSLFIVLGLWGLVYSGSRYLIYAIPFCILVIIFLKNFWGGVISLLVSLLLCFLIIVNSKDIQERLTRASDLKMTSNFQRIQLLQGYYELIKENFFFGVGINNERYVKKYLKKIFKSGFLTSHAHNHFVHVLGEVGILGFIFFLWFNALWLFKLFKSFFSSEDLILKSFFASGIAIFFSFHVAGLTQNTYGDSEVAYGMFYIMGFLMMLISLPALPNKFVGVIRPLF